jgi:hypothetical protein
MLKYFSSFLGKDVNTGGSKAIYDLQKTIKDFLTNEKIQHAEYNLSNLRNIIYLFTPSAYSKYLIFGYIGTPVFRPPLVIVFFFIFCFVFVKKIISRETFYLIVIDLLEWQRTLWRNKKDKTCGLIRVFQCLLERILISNIADEVISVIDPEFLTKYYRTKKIYDLEFLDYYITSEPPNYQSGPISILYAGDLSRGFDVDFLEDILKNLDNSVRLLVAGYGLNESLEKRLRKFQNFCFLGQLDSKALDKVARECQFGLIVYPPEHLYYNIVPLSKSSFYIANGLTIISTNLRRIKKLNDKYDFGYLLEKEEVLQFIRNLSTKQIKRNKILEEKIANGKFLYNILTKIDFN